MSAPYTKTPSRPGPRLDCQVKVSFIREQSQLPDGPYAYSYTITIRNVGDQAGQVIARQWLITEADGRTQEVRGLAVVGHQPLLQPGEQFEYNSWVQVETPVASMRGTYFCMSDDAHPFEADIPAFDLVYPGMLH